MTKPTHGTWNIKTRPANWDDFDHDIKYKQQLDNLPRVKTGISNHCYKPFNTLNIDYKGRVFHCDCDGWLPFSSGKVLDFNSIDAVMQSIELQEIQNSITDRTFKFCDIRYCGIEKKSQGTPDTNIHLHLGIDNGCNLSCPSCRERVIFDASPEYVNEKNQWVDQIVEWICNSERKFYITIGSNGEPFASPVYLYLLEQIQDLDNISLTVRTNGTLKLSMLPKTLTDLYISIDAGSKEVYEQVRRGARWESLLKNLEYLKELNQISVTANFVIQKTNLLDISNFVNLCCDYNMKPNYAVLEDWGTWHNFESQCVHLPASPDYKTFIDIIKQLNISL